MPRQQKHPDLSRDDRIKVITLRNTGLTYAEIQAQLLETEGLKCTIRQIQHAVKAGHPILKKRKGRNLYLSKQQVKELVVFVCSLRTNRLMLYIYLASGLFAYWGVGKYLIRNALRKQGFLRYIARAKPPLAEHNRKIRL